MRKLEFQKTLETLPGLTENGWMNPQDPNYPGLRKKFYEGALYLQQALDATEYLQRFQKSVLISPWQKANCVPAKLKSLIEWYSQRPVSIGAIVVAAAHLGFRIGWEGADTEPHFNIFARQLEAELRDFRLRQIISKAVGE
ncbi:MAG: hypothetical protein ACOH5I_23895 [Oligoflexus sp.]